jgi:hypothetical protein
MPVEAQVNVGDIRRAFYDDFAQGDRWWWWDRELLVNPNEFIAEDDEGDLWRVPFNLIEQSGDDPDEIEFGDPEAIKIKYVPDKKRADDNAEAVVKLVSARLSDAGTVLATNASPPPDRARGNQKKEATVDQQVIQNLRRLHGLSEEQLPDDATDEAIADALAGIETPETPPPAGDPPEGDPGEGGEGGEGEGEGEEPNPNPEGVEIPEGMALIDAETLKGLQEGAQEGIAASRRLKEGDKSKLLDGAVKAGKFPPSRREHYAKAYDADPKGTRDLINQLAPGLVPVDERGNAGNVEEFGEADAYPSDWLPDVAARKAALAAGGGGTPVIAHERDPNGR